MADELAEVLRAAQKLPFGFVARTGAGFAPFGVWIFPINPEDYSVTNLPKGSITQTTGGNWEDRFGLGVGSGSIRGTFGFKPRMVNGMTINPAGLLPGQAQFKFVEALFKSFYSFTQEEARRLDTTMDFFSLSDAHFFRVRLQKFQFDRSTRFQFLYRYDISFDILEDYLQGGITKVGTAIAGGLNAVTGSVATIGNNLASLVGF